MKNLFFIYDNENWRSAKDRLYGYILKDGQIKDNLLDFNPDEYYKYCGNFIAFKECNNSIIAYQDSNASFGLYYYSHNGYFAISNSFLLLFIYLKNKNIKLRTCVHKL